MSNQKEYTFSFYMRDKRFMRENDNVFLAYSRKFNIDCKGDFNALSRFMLFFNPRTKQSFAFYVEDYSLIGDAREIVVECLCDSPYTEHAQFLLHRPVSIKFNFEEQQRVVQNNDL